MSNTLFNFKIIINLSRMILGDFERGMHFIKKSKQGLALYGKIIKDDCDWWFFCMQSQHVTHNGWRHDEG